MATKEQILKENKRLQNKIKRVLKKLEVSEQKLKDGYQQVLDLIVIVTKYQEEQAAKERRKELTRKTCVHCKERKATTIDHKNKPVCKQCFNSIAQMFAHGY